MELPYTREELTTYTENRKLGLSEKSLYWIVKAHEVFWNFTHGFITQKSFTDLHNYLLTTYESEYSRSKVLSFGTAFLRYLSKTRFDNKYRAFSMFLERPKAIRERKTITARVITQQDIKNLIDRITASEKNGTLSQYRANQYRAMVLFGAYTGQRSMATISKLTVGQFREAMKSPKPCLHVLSSQDKIKMEHWVPLHPRVVEGLIPLCDGKADDAPMFEYNSFWMWLKRLKLPLSQCAGHFVFGDLRKFCEQQGDILQWNQSNRAYIMTHGVSGVDWAHYKHPLPENVYNIYMEYWNEIGVVLMNNSID